MKKEVMGKMKRAEGKRTEGGSTKARTVMAEKMDKAMEKKGERNETKKSDKVNRVTAKK